MYIYYAKLSYTMDNIFLYQCYFTFGWCLSFAAIAVQFTLINHLNLSPVDVSMGMVMVSSPWCFKPLYGIVSDSYPIFDWGNRRPYISISFYLASFVYVCINVVIESPKLFVLALTFISWLVCYADVCSDSIMVKMTKKEEIVGHIQSNCWTARALGSLIGAFTGGIAYSAIGAVNVFRICAIMPFITSISVWKLKKVSSKQNNRVFSVLWKNLKEQKHLAGLLFVMNIAPNYGQFYVYFLQEQLGYSPTQFSWLTVSSSLTFFLATITYNRFLLDKPAGIIILMGLMGTYLCRMAQLFVVLDIFPYFWIVLCDGVAESFFGTLILMPLIILVSKGCHEGVEGSLYATMMAISNLSGVIGDWLGTVLGVILHVDRNNLQRMNWFIFIAATLELCIPLFFILKMSSFYETSLAQEEPQDLDHTLEPEDPEILESKQVTLEIQEENKRAKSASKPGFWGKRPWSALRQTDTMVKSVSTEETEEHWDRT